ncbi:MAG: leucyl aminopeptidase family protein [Alphaproteobacteria bacterium]|nr:leucyl aminopeptidase family protein [Alphaproteobacteria bacterium]
MSERLPFRPKKLASTIRLTAIARSELPKFLKAVSAAQRRYAEQSDFKAGTGEFLALPARTGGIDRIVVGIPERESPDGNGSQFWAWAGLPMRLPAGSYRLDPEPQGAETATRIAAAWGIGSYVFDRYRKAARAPAQLVWPARADRAAVTALVESDAFARDLINTPAEDMGPGELAEAARDMARELGMQAKVIVGDALRTQGYNLVHAVGRAAARDPRLIELTWGDARHPRVAIVGKGVCFDTGGLGIKPDAGMKLMKKDMGGAAHALALARLVVQAKLKVRLQVLVPAVENSVSGNSVRPLDVIRSKAGLTVEIGHTDAEGRLILADAFARAGEEKPELMIDFATLTGAARVALGPDLPALFCNDDALAHELLTTGLAQSDPMWLMPLWQAYRQRIESKVADLNNVSDSPFAGAAIAALFLQAFVPAGVKWAHIDLLAWSPWPRPGRPEGAMLQTVRSTFALLARRYPA